MDPITAALREGFAFTLEVHGLCVLVLAVLYFSMLRDRAENRISPLLSGLYLVCALVLLSDAAWEAVDFFGVRAPVLLYLPNLVYYISTALGVALWLLFCASEVSSRSAARAEQRVALALPAIGFCMLVLSTPLNGWIFSFEDGAYVRGPLFALSAGLDLAYLIAGLYMALRHARRAEFPWKRRHFLSFCLFPLPVTVLGVAQALTGYDFNCVGLTVGLAMLYCAGVSNFTREKSVMTEAVIASYDAAFRVDLAADTICNLRLTDRYFGSVAAGESSYRAWLRDSW